MTMKWGYDPGEVEYLEQQGGRNAPGSPADVAEQSMGMSANIKARGERAARETQRPRGVKATLPSPIVGDNTSPIRKTYGGSGAEPGFFPGEPVDQPYQQPMFNQSLMWNVPPGQQGFVDAGYSINPYSPTWSPSALNANMNVPYNPMNYYAGTQALANDPNLQGAHRVFPQQEMTPGVLAGLLGQYGNPFWQQVGATPYGYNPMGIQPQPGVSNPMMSGVQRLLNRSAPARYGSRGR